MTQSIQAYKIRKHSNSLHNAQIGNNIAHNNVNSKVLSFDVHNRSFYLFCILHWTLVGIVELPQIVQISQIQGKMAGGARAPVQGDAQDGGTHAAEGLGLHGAAPAAHPFAGEALVMVAAGTSHFCALTETGVVWVWGSNQDHTRCRCALGT